VTKSPTPASDSDIFLCINCNRKEKIMPCNEGKVDRALRVIVGLVLLALVFTGPQTPWGWIGLVPLLTGIFGFCPAYKLLGINTCKAR
jgi:hypothetical protein